MENAKWELVQEDKDRKTLRLRVMGGWLYYVIRARPPIPDGPLPNLRSNASPVEDLALPFVENVPMQDYIQHQVQHRLISLVQDVRQLFPSARPATSSPS